MISQKLKFMDLSHSKDMVGEYDGKAAVELKTTKTDEFE